MRVRLAERGLGVIGIVAAALMATAEPALADPPPDFPPCSREPTQADVDGAAGSHRAAKAYYERADYDKAIQLWRDAYNFDCTKPAVFLNMANAYEKKGDKVAAVAMLETYLVRAPKDAADASTISAKINNLKSSIKAQPEPAATAPAPTSTAPPPGPAPTASVQPDAPTPPATGERPFGVIPWVVAGVGAAAAIGGIVPLVIGFSDISAAEELCGAEHDSCPRNPDREEQAIIDAGESGQNLVTVGWVLVGVGAGALVGGLVWQFVFNNPEPASTTGRVKAPATAVQVAPWVGARQQGVSLTGNF
jgi:hypothetical protein